MTFYHFLKILNAYAHKVHFEQVKNYRFEIAIILRLNPITIPK